MTLEYQWKINAAMCPALLIYKRSRPKIAFCPSNPLEDFRRISLKDINWVIGVGVRLQGAPMEEAWALKLRDQYRQ